MAVLAAIALLVAPALVGWASGRLDRRRLLGLDSHVAAMTEQYALTPPEQAEVESAVARGRALTDARLRAAAVRWAAEAVGTPPGRWARWHTWALVVGLAALGVVAAARERFSVVPIGWMLQWLVASMWLERGPRRAIELNSGPPSS